MEEDKFGFESLRLAKENVSRAANHFIKFCIYTVLIIVLLKTASMQSEITTGIFGKINTSLFLEYQLFIRLFIAFVLLFSFLEWTINVIILYRHPLYIKHVDLISLPTVIANAWDRVVKVRGLKFLNILYFFENIIIVFLVITILIVLFFF